MIHDGDYLVFLGEGIYDQDDGDDYGIYHGDIIHVDEVLERNGSDTIARIVYGEVGLRILLYENSYVKATDEEILRYKLS